IGIAVLFLGISIVLAVMSSSADAEAAGHASKWSRFFHAYVIGWAFIATVPIGMLWIILLHFLVRGRWLTVVRRISEAMTGSFLLVWIAGLGFVLPVLFGYQDLYYWANDAAKDAALNPTLAHKLGWLSPGAWAIRYVVYGAIFVGMSGYFAR